jgi:hypothetical protein
MFQGFAFEFSIFHLRVQCPLFGSDHVHLYACIYVSNLVHFTFMRS